MRSLTEDLHAAAARYHRALTPFRPGKRGRSPNREAAYAAIKTIHTRFEGAPDLAAALVIEGVDAATARQLSLELDTFCTARSQDALARYAAFKALRPLTDDAMKQHGSAGRPIAARRPAPRKDLDG